MILFLQKIIRKKSTKDLDDSKRFHILASVKGKDISSTIKTYKTMTNYDKIHYGEQINLIKETLPIVLDFSKENIYKVTMEVDIIGGGFIVRFTRDAPHAQYHCERRTYKFSYWDDIKELKSKINKLKRFLKSKCVYEFHFGISND